VSAHPHHCPVDDQGVGRVLRAIRIQHGLRQSDVASTAKVSRSLVSLAERGHLDDLRLVDLRRVGAALEVRLFVRPSYRGGEADRVANAAHTAMEDRIAELFDALDGWQFAAEATFSVFGERGSIDVLAWHAGRRALLVVELKTEVPDPSGLLAQVDRYRRLARTPAQDRGWNPETVSSWVVIAETDMNRRMLARRRTLLRNAFPLDGRAMRTWLHDPDHAIHGLSFLANAREDSTTERFGPTKRVRIRPETPEPGPTTPDLGEKPR